MRSMQIFTSCAATCALPLLGLQAAANPKPVELSAAGQSLKAVYSSQAETLKAQSEKALPTLDATKKNVFMLAHYHEGPKKGVEGRHHAFSLA